MAEKATSIDDYLKNIPAERLEYFKKLRKTVSDNIPKGFKETISYGMIGYVVPHSTYPKGYHCTPELPLPFVNIASQKGFIAIYHMGVYVNKKILDWFVAEYPKHSKYKLDMGKSCIRFKKADQIPYELIGELMRKISVDEWIETYERVLKK